jgi:1-acyl-sn-glycerol-3-phosphate acyltransferase
MGFLYRIGHFLAKLVGWFFCSFRVENREGLEGVRGGLIIASNHVSFLDPPLIGSAFREPIHYFARKTLFEHPVMKFVLPRVNAWPVNQERPEISVLKKIISLLREGEKVLIFPEGERSWDGKLNMESRAGVGMIVSKAGVPVLPVRLFGPERALPRGGKSIRRHPATLVVGEPVYFDDLLADGSLGAKERYGAIAERIMKKISNLQMSTSRGE